jgi:diaminopimelate epimerase
MRLPFTKMQGAGNDFVVLDATRAPLALSPAQLRRLGDRRFGVGADQILIVEPGGEPGIDFRYRIFNGASGAEVEHCGNGARCFVRFVHEQGLTQQRTVRVRTVNRVLTLALQADDRVSVEMGRPDFDPAALPFDPAGLQPQPGARGWPRWCVEGAEAHPLAVLSMGNPHAVLRVDDVDTAPVATLGPLIERHRRFARGVNVGFLQVLSPTSARLRVHERDAGETLACGTGACAAVVAGIRLGWLARRVEVAARGGQLLVEWPADEAPVLMTGPAETVYEGTIEL